MGAMKRDIQGLALGDYKGGPSGKKEEVEK